MKKIILDSLAFCVTRRCNQNCNHCCKGKSQNIDMKEDVIDNLFRNKDMRIIEISHLSITGGEPTLVPNIINYLINTIIDLNISITSHVVFITNGLIYDQSIIDSINKLMNFLKSKEESKDVELVFEISNDQFHKRPNKDILDKYAELPFLNKKFLEPRVRSNESIINEGNAKENNIGGSSTYKDFITDIDIKELNNIIEVEGSLLVSANGNIVNCSCASYIIEDEIKLGNICEASLLDII